MKALSLVVLITGCAMMHSVARAFPSDAGWQQNLANPNTASNDTARNADTEAAHTTRETPDQKPANVRHNRSGRVLPSKKINANAHVGANRTNYLKPVQAGGNRLGPQAPMNVHPGSSTNLAGSNRLPAFVAGTGVAIGGQQFRKGHNSSTAAIGGSANPGRGTAAINGTVITRRR